MKIFKNILLRVFKERDLFYFCHEIGCNSYNLNKDKNIKKTHLMPHFEKIWKLLSIKIEYVVVTEIASYMQV